MLYDLDKYYFIANKTAMGLDKKLSQLICIVLSLQIRIMTTNLAYTNIDNI